MYEFEVHKVAQNKAKVFFSFKDQYSYINAANNLL